MTDLAQKVFVPELKKIAVVLIVVVLFCSVFFFFKNPELSSSNAESNSWNPESR